MLTKQTADHYDVIISKLHKWADYLFLSSTNTSEHWSNKYDQFKTFLFPYELLSVRGNMNFALGREKVKLIKGCDDDLTKACDDNLIGGTILTLTFQEIIDDIPLLIKATFDDVESEKGLVTYKCESGSFKPYNVNHNFVCFLFHHTDSHSTNQLLA